MGFTVCSPIPSNFNYVGSWEEAVAPCCHCTIQGNCPPKKKQQQFSSHCNVGLAEPYRCQSLWAVCSGLTKKAVYKHPNLDTVSDVGFPKENPIHISKKQKSAPRVAVEDKIF
jgi:hypothetical protein